MLVLLSRTLVTAARFGKLWCDRKEELAKITDSPYDADARQLLNTLELKIIQDSIDTEINTIVFKALNGLAPEYFHFIYLKLFNVGIEQSSYITT